MDAIHIHDLELECIVGIHPHERVQEQTLIVNATLYLDTHSAARSGRIGRTVHYAEVAEQVAALLRFRRYRLLEVAASEVACMLLGLHPRLERVRLEIRKPQALSGLAKAASLTIERDRAWLQQGMRGTLGVGAGPVHLWQSHEASMSMQSILPAQVMSVYRPGPAVVALEHEAAARTPTRGIVGPSVHARARAEVSVFVWVMAGQLQSESRLLHAGQFAEGQGATPTWRNTGALVARALCCATWCERDLVQYDEPHSIVS